MIKNNSCMYRLSKTPDAGPSSLAYIPQCNSDAVISTPVDKVITHNKATCPLCARQIVLQTNISQLCKKLKSSIIPHKKWYKPRGG